MSVTSVFIVDDKEYAVGFFGCDEHLLAYFFFEDVVGVDDPAAGVDDGE